MKTFNSHKIDDNTLNVNANGEITSLGKMKVSSNDSTSDYLENKLEYDYFDTNKQIPKGFMINNDYSGVKKRALSPRVSADYIVETVAELDYALDDIRNSGIGGEVFLLRGTYDKGSPFYIPNVSNIMIRSFGAKFIQTSGQSVFIFEDDGGNTLVDRRGISGIEIQTTGNVSTIKTATITEDGMPNWGKLIFENINFTGDVTNCIEISSFEAFVTQMKCNTKNTLLRFHHVLFVNIFDNPHVTAQLLYQTSSQRDINIQIYNNFVFLYKSNIPHIYFNIVATDGPQLKIINNSFGWSSGNKNTSGYVIEDGRVTSGAGNSAVGGIMGNNMFYHTGSTSGVEHFTNFDTNIIHVYNNYQTSN